MRKFYYKIISCILIVTIIFSNFAIVNASSTQNIVSSYVMNKNLTSLDLSFISDILRLNLKDIPNFLKDQVENLQNYERENIDLVKSGNYNSSLLLGGYSGGGGATRTFYSNEIDRIKEFKELVKDYNLRKSVDSNNLDKLISSNMIMDNSKFNELFQKWNNKILEYYSYDKDKDLSNYDSYEINDIKIWYMKEDIEYVNFNNVIDTSNYIYNHGPIMDIGGALRPLYEYVVTDRIIFNADFFWGYDDDKTIDVIQKRLDSGEVYVEKAYQMPKEARDLIYFNENADDNTLYPDEFLMFGSSEMNNPNENIALYGINYKNHTYGDGKVGYTYQKIKYQKFLVRLPNNKFKIAYIVDFDANRDGNDTDEAEKSRFTEYFPKIVSLQQDLLYRYFRYSNQYDFDLGDQTSINININDLIIPYNSNNLYDKKILKKLDNIEDYLLYLMTNLNYDKNFRRINKRLDNFNGLVLQLNDKIDFLINKVNNLNLFDYEKLNEIIKENLEEFNQKYIERLSEDLTYITNLVKENKIEILRNNDDIVNVYNKLNEVETNINNFKDDTKQIKEDLEYLKTVIKSSDQISTDNSFKDKFNEAGSDRINESINFIDKFLKFINNFFTVTEKIEIQKLDTFDLSKKFPFSIFTDIKNIFNSLVRPPKVPVFEFPLFTEKIVLDFNNFKELAAIIRTFTLLTFIIAIALKMNNKAG